MRSRAGLGWAALVLGVLVVGLLVVDTSPRNLRPLDPASTGPSGMRGVVLLVEELGGEVDVRANVGGDEDTALLLVDELADDQRVALRAWVRRGGVLVVTDLGSPFAADPATRAACPPALRDVEVLRFAPDVAVRRGTDCFGGAVRVERLDDGHIVTMESPAPLFNALLDQDDNAVLVASLLVPTGRERVAFLRGAVGSGDQQLFDLLGPRVAQALVQLAVAAVAYVLWRGRRLGRPVAERQAVRVAGSELVAAVGRLLGARHRPGDAAATMRQALARELEARVGVAPGAFDALVAAVAARTGLDDQWVAAVLVTRPVATDADLVALCADLDRIRALALDPEARAAGRGPAPDPAPQPEGALQ